MISSPLAPDTLTVTCFVAVPPAPETVSVYFVVTEGLIDFVPLVATAPMPSIDAEVPPVDAHASVTLCPTVIEEGDASNTVIVGAEVFVRDIAGRKPTMR